MRSFRKIPLALSVLLVICGIFGLCSDLIFAVTPEPLTISMQPVNLTTKDATDKTSILNIADGDTLVKLGAIFLGWLLGEGTRWIREYYRIRNLKKALISELQDCRSQLLRNKLTLRYIIQHSFLGEPFDIVPAKIQTHIFDKYFPEISIYLGSSERISLNSIHNLIQRSYIQFDQMKTFNIELVKATYHNVSNAIVQIKLHLKYRNKLNVFAFDKGDLKKQLDKDVENEFQKMIQEAKEQGLEGVRKKYYETQYVMM